MSTTIARCANLSLSVQIPTLTCDNNTLGVVGNLSDFGAALGSIPSQLGQIADCVADDVKAQITQAIAQLRESERHIWCDQYNHSHTPVAQSGHTHH